MVHFLSRDQARRIIVRAQLLDADRPGEVVEVAEQLGYIKLDPTSTIAPCEQTVLFSRIGLEYDVGQLSRATELDKQLFEFDGAYRPMSLLPLLMPMFRLGPQRESTRQWMTANAIFAEEVLGRLRDEGPMLASQIPDTAQASRAPDGWFGSNQVPIMLDILHRSGEVAIVRREGRQRIWDLAERIYPSDMPDYSLEDAQRRLEYRRLQAAGLAKNNSPWSGTAMAGEAAVVEGSKWKWRVDPRALDRLDEAAPGRVAILNPYDSMLFDRPRLVQAFDFTYVLEQFKPKAQRKYGFFAHPILIDDRFVGFLEAEVDHAHDALLVRNVHELEPFEQEDAERVWAEIANLATWLGVEVRDAP